MRVSSLLFAGLSAGLVSAVPQLEPRWGSNPLGLKQSDLEVLAFALNLENLEVNFYTTALGMFDDAAFTAANFSTDVRGRFEQVLEHELVHVALLQSVLGTAAPKPCNYSFPLKQVQDLVDISFALESGGEAAYLGATGVLKNNGILRTAASIATIEGRQSSFLGGLQGLSPWYGPFSTPLNQTQIVSLIAGLIVDCPSDNFPLAVEPVPALTVTPNFGVTVGQTVTVAVGAPDFDPAKFPIQDSSLKNAPPASVAPPKSGWFLAYFHGGSNVTFSPVAGDMTTVIPPGLAGNVWAQLVDTNQGFPTIDNVISGVSMLVIPVPADSDNSFN